MVKHGKLEVLDRRTGKKITDTCKIDYNKEWEYGFGMSFATFEVKFDRLTRNTFVPWGKPDEIRYDVTITCDHCNQSSQEYKSGAQSMSNKTRVIGWSCKCKKTIVKIKIETTSNGVFEVLDWVPLAGTAARFGQAGVLGVQGRGKEAKEALVKGCGNLASDAIVIASGGTALVAKAAPIDTIASAVLKQTALATSDAVLGSSDGYKVMGSGYNNGRCNGNYYKSGRKSQGLPIYQKKGGGILFCAKNKKGKLVWRITDDNDTGGWVYEAPSYGKIVDCDDRWTSDGYNGGDAGTCPMLRKIEQ